MRGHLFIVLSNLNLRSAHNELVGNRSDFSLLSDLIACADDLVTADPQLVMFSLS